MLWKGNNVVLVHKMRQKSTFAGKKIWLWGESFVLVLSESKNRHAHTHTHGALACEHWFDVHFTPNYPPNSYRKSHIVTKLKISSCAPLPITAGIMALLPLFTFPSYNVCLALNYPAVGASNSSMFCKMIFLFFTSLQLFFPSWLPSFTH